MKRIAALITVLAMVFMFEGMSSAGPAPVEKTGQTTSYATGDDGQLEMGVPWPNPRFTDNGNGTVTDNLTGLIWLKNANCFGKRRWADALAGSNILANGQCGLTDGSSPGDWRLPNIKELQSLIHYGVYKPVLSNTAGNGKWSEGDPFTGVQETSCYYSSTANAKSTGYKICMNMSYGKDTGATGSHYVMPVRGETFSAGPAPVEKTGQTTSYATGDDGHLEKGVSWPNPRFTDNGDGTVTDNLTGLIWLKDANCFGARLWADALAGSNILADGMCGLTDGSSPGDWRLPNIKELQSLIHCGVYGPALSNTAGNGKWSEGDPFTDVANVREYRFWSATTTPASDRGAYQVNMYHGRTQSTLKGYTYGVWPVRGGSVVVFKFIDVPTGYWAEDYIYAIFDAGITTGCSQNPLKYCPKDPVTREQMAAFIVRAVEGEPAANYCATGSPFSDVSSSSFFCKYIKRLSEMGITTGCGGGKYCPNDTVTREQMAAFIVRAVEGEPPANYCATGSPFPDVSPSSFFCKYIKRLFESDITTGYGDGTYRPKNTVTREQMAAFLARAFLGMD